MKTTVVPAQVTTVEDRIAGNLSFTQLVLLVAPVFLSAALFAGLPPFFALPIYKLVICGIVSILCLLLCIRIKGVIVLHWLIVVLRFRFRPQFYVYNKNDTAHRTETINVSEQPAIREIIEPIVINPVQLSISDRLTAEKVISAKTRSLQFTTKKGVLRAVIYEVSEKGI